MAMNLWIGCLCTLALISHPIIHAAFDCANVVIANHQFDLSPIFKSDISISVAKPTPPSTSVSEFRINPCRTLVSQKDTCDKDSWLCIIKTVTRDDITLVTEIQNLVKGTAPLPVVSYADNPSASLGLSILTLTYTGKKPDGDSFTAQVEFHCAKDASMPEITQQNCGPIIFKFRGPAACPKSPTDGSAGPVDSKVSDGMNFVFSLAIIFFVYMVVGALYRRFFLKATGTDQIPHFEFWSELPHYFTELLDTIKSKFGGAPRGYIQV